MEIIENPLCAFDQVEPLCSGFSDADGSALEGTNTNGNTKMKNTHLLSAHCPIKFPLAFPKFVDFFLFPGFWNVNPNSVLGWKETMKC